MNDKEYEKQKKRVLKLSEKWRNPLGLGWWRITEVFSRERSTNETAYAPPSTNGKYDSVFEVSTDYYYKTAVITAYLPVIQNVSDSDLERYYIHELMHIHLSAMKHPDRAKEEELTATSLADAFLWVVEATKRKEL